MATGRDWELSFRGAKTTNVTDIGLNTWNRALLDVLLPFRDRTGTPVALACDDEALHQVAERAGIDPAGAVDDLVWTVRRELHVDVARGLNDMFALLGKFERAPRPRPTPDFLAPLSLCVLAASRMAPDAKVGTNAYYPRLRQLLHLPVTGGELPGMRSVPLTMRALAEWLRHDLKGVRGHLAISTDRGYPLVGPCVAQTIFRERDRQILSRYFSAKAASLQAGLDPVLLLRRWSGRHWLTQHAQRMLDDPDMEEGVRACLNTAWTTWDGSVLEPGFRGRTWPATLQLIPRPRRLALLASCRSPLPVDVLLDGRVSRLEPGRQLSLPWSVLAEASEAGVTLGDPLAAGGAIRVPPLGNTVQFEETEQGLVRTTTPASSTVWALTREPTLQTRFARHQAPAEVLPRGWVLLRDLPAEEVVGARTQAERIETRAALGVEGGLRLEPRVYLSGEGPWLVADSLGEVGTISVLVNGEQIGILAPGGRVALPASAAGTYRVTAGQGLYSATYHVQERGASAGGSGTLSYHMERWPLRSGARPTRTGSRWLVCGAVVSLPHAGPLPLMRRASAAALVIRRDGACKWHLRPVDPPWLATVGLPVGARWEVPTSDAAWVLFPDSAEVRQISDTLPAQLSPDAAEGVLTIGRKVVVKDSGGARLPLEKWLELFSLAERMRG